jgi:pimeloyl-ACP methyl ester carboxylesterase
MSHSTDKVRVRDTQINLRKSGQGNPILFLHAAGGVLDWMPFFDKLAGLGELWVPDHPGWGTSDNPAWIKNIPDLAMYYLDFLDAHAPAQGFDVVAHSLGGWIAAEIAVRNSSKIRSLTLIAPAGIRVKGVPVGDNFIWNNQEIAQNYYFDKALQERSLTVERTEEQTEQMVKNKYSFAKHAWHPRLFNPDLEKWLHRVKVPTQIIWGREDRLIPAAYAEAWQAGIPGSQVTVIPECGHLPTVEKSDQVVSQIARFIGAAA